jgi:hypothetical protein
MLEVIIAKPQASLIIIFLKKTKTKGLIVST